MYTCEERTKDAIDTPAVSIFETRIWHLNIYRYTYSETRIGEVRDRGAVLGWVVHNFYIGLGCVDVVRFIINLLIYIVKGLVDKKQVRFILRKIIRKFT